MGKYAIQSNPIAEMQGQRRNTLINDRQQQLFEQSKVEHPLRTEQMKQSNQMGSMKLDDATQQAKIKKEVLFGARLAAFSGGARDAELDRIIQSSIQNNDPDTTKKAQAIKALSAKDQDEMLSKVVQLGEQMNILERDPARAQNQPRELQIFYEAKRLAAAGDQEGADRLMASLSGGKDSKTDKQWANAKEQQMKEAGKSPEELRRFRFSTGTQTGEDEIWLNAEKNAPELKKDAEEAEYKRVKAAETIRDTISNFEITANLAEDLIKDSESKNMGGLGEVLWSNIFGTDQSDFTKGVGQLLQRMGLGNLKELKTLSSTGASGLGATSAMEIQMLMNQVARLDVGLSKDEKVKQLTKVMDHHRRVAAAMTRDMRVSEMKRQGQEININRLAGDIKNEYKLDDRRAWAIAGGDPMANPEPQFMEARSRGNMLEHEGNFRVMPSETIEWMATNPNSVRWGDYSDQELAVFAQTAKKYQIPLPSTK